MIILWENYYLAFNDGVVLTYFSARDTDPQTDVDHDEDDEPVVRRSNRLAKVNHGPSSHILDEDDELPQNNNHDNNNSQDVSNVEDDFMSDQDNSRRYHLRSKKRLVSYAQKKLDHDLSDFDTPDQRRSYTLRPRTEPKDYRVRIPLYEASPKKSENRRRQQSSRFNMRRFGEGGFMNAFNFGGRFDSLLMGPMLGEDSDDDDTKQQDSHRDNIRVARLNATGPLNRSRPNDVDRLLLSGKPQLNSGKTLADTDPLAIDTSIDFSSVGGLDDHIKQLKEMVLLPLLYPEVFAKFNIAPPRGVLFHGPPGTGKTLLARALANACSTEQNKVAFFMRKGADVLSKWVGESERQLKALFEQARLVQPAIIFFDEIDGLAPVRSAKQDQIHSSIVATLLALMDGLENRGQVIVIGATNRYGRFFEEYFFVLTV
jgi:SpoVK/Ycf46/Vps4 family AAA+-type ATPase